MTIKSPKKLIEVALPLDDINAAAAREKSIRHGHPSTLHLWWARRPLAAARAVLFAQMVNDPGGERGYKAGLTREQANAKREKLFEIMHELVKWENSNNEQVLERARAAIRESWRETCEMNGSPTGGKPGFDPDKLPAFHDPFAGGGAIPLEAQRLGLEAHASDLNPVAVLINKAMIEIPPKFAGRPPVSLGARASRPHKNWHSRGYLPHLDQPGLVQSITFRLHDSLPAKVAKELAAAEESPERRKRFEKYLDSGYGECWLARPEIAPLVERALLHFDGERYRLLAWCVMPNHVHVLIETRSGFRIGDVVGGWKSWTAKEINRILEREGKVWMADYHDRYIRDEKHLQTAIDYIENNPVSAGLVKRAEDWTVSSAGQERTAARETRALPGSEDWSGARGLAEDVRRYGQWMRDEAFKRIGHLYPPVEITQEMVDNPDNYRPDLQQYVGRKLTVIAWLWARTVKSPNPAYRHVDVPLVSNFMLSTKKGKEAYVEPVVEGDFYRFEVRKGMPADLDSKKKGTKLSQGSFGCLLSGAPMKYAYIDDEANAGRMGAKLMAVVLEGERERVYISPTTGFEQIAASAQPEWKPETPSRGTWASNAQGRVYGFRTFGDYFTPRQLVALNTFSDLIAEARERARTDALAVGLPNNPIPLHQGGSGAAAYGDAVATYLAFALSRSVDRGSSICSWDSSPKMEALRNTFGRQAIPMVWDFAEGSPFSESSGNWINNVTWAVKAIEKLPGSACGVALQENATLQETSSRKLVSTDPPYYDNIGYADLSDIFYVWLRRALKDIHPEICSTLAVPKAEELVATPYRHGGKEEAEAFFMSGMTEAMHNLAEKANPVFPVTIYYAFKQSERKGNGDTASTGWETFLEAVLKAGFAITGTWPMRTELGNRMIGSGANALASSIILVCRPREANAEAISRKDFQRQLRAELPEALETMIGGRQGEISPIAPVDLAQAAIGPGMAVYSRYSAVLEADGSPMKVREALILINRVVDEYFNQAGEELDADTRFCIDWFSTQGWKTGKFGEADTLARAKGTSVEGVQEAGVVESGNGKVRLLRWKEYPADWNPGKDHRLPAWEALHHLIRAFNTAGESAAGQLLGQMPERGESLRQLAYRLYTLCERKKWAEDARAYNEIIQAWGRIVEESAAQPAGMQSSLEL